MDPPKVEPLDPEYEEAWNIASQFLFEIMDRARLQKACGGKYYLPGELAHFFDDLKIPYERGTKGRIKTDLKYANWRPVRDLQRKISDHALGEYKHLVGEAFIAKHKKEVKQVGALAKELSEVAKPIVENWKKEVPTYYTERVPSKESERFLKELRSQVINPWNERVLKKKLETIPTLCLACGRPIIGRAENPHDRRPALYCTRECAKYGLKMKLAEQLLKKLAFRGA
jgi:hypothetical protein